MTTEQSDETAVDAADGTPTEESTATGFETQTTPLRIRIQELGLWLTGALALLMIGFVAVDWIRTMPGVAGETGQIAFEQVLVIGEWIDFYLGTSSFQHPFTWRQVATGVLVGIVGPLVGVYLVHRQMALIGETLAHTAFAGVAVGILFVAFTGWEGSLLVIALIVSVVAALGLQWLTEHTSGYGDVPIAITLTGSFAVGTLLISWGRDFVSVPIDIEQFLFGNMSIVTVEGARIVAVLTVVVVALVAINYKQFLFITFDEQAAKVARLNVRGYEALLIAMTAVVVVGAMQILGVILVAGLLVIPVAAASQVARSFRETLYLSVLVGQASILLGIGISIVRGLPSGGTVIVVAIGWYLLSIAIADGRRAIATH